MPPPKTARVDALGPGFEDRRTPPGANGLRVRLKRLLGALKRPLRLQRRGLQWHLVLLERRRQPSPFRPPTDVQQIAALRERLLAVDHELAANGMRQLLHVHDMLCRSGWSGLERFPARELARALAQCELLASAEPSPSIAALIDRLRIVKAGVEAREDRRSALLAAHRAASDDDTPVEVSETGLDDFDAVRRDFADTLATPRDTTAVSAGG